MNAAEKELQQRIEANLPVGATPDARAYKKVFESLSREPFELPVDFADTVLLRIESRKSRFSSDILWLSFGLAVLLLAGIITGVALRVSINFGAFKFVSGYGGLLIFSLALILGFHWIDRAIIRKKMSF
jgi:hypothetical protein